MKRTIVMYAAIPMVALLAACGSSSTTGTPTPGAATLAPTSTPAPTAAPTATPTPPPAAVDLSGSWAGTYSGAFTGTFTLTWNQTSGALAGTIKLSSSSSPLDITGTVNGSAITFGAVGGVVYSGTVNGKSMSGTYQVPGGGSGTWSATES